MDQCKKIRMLERISFHIALRETEDSAITCQSPIEEETIAILLLKQLEELLPPTVVTANSLKGSYS